jgi:hypothetical protein
MNVDGWILHRAYVNTRITKFSYSTVELKLSHFDDGPSSIYNTNANQNLAVSEVQKVHSSSSTGSKSC